MSTDTVTNAALAAPARGRSLWDDAFARLKSNKAAMASLAFLVLMTIACVIGPYLTGHDYDKVYSDYVKVGPSLDTYPRANQVEETFARTVRRFRAEVRGFEFTGSLVKAEVASTRAIDPRLADFLGRSDMFSAVRIVETREEGRIVTIEGDVKTLRFLFGTDANGRDLLTRTLIAGRVSLAIGLLATGVALLIGVAYGAISGYAGGRVDMVMMRIVDVLYSLPFIFFVILLVVFFGRNFVLMFIAVGAIEWLDMARIVRGQTLSIKRQEYVQAAEAMGVEPAGILRRHVVPNTLGPVVVYMTLMVPKVILLESFLSFLGLGVQEPMTSWGVLISEGANAIQGTPYLLIFPSLFLTFSLFALNFLGDGLRDALDPKDR